MNNERSHYDANLQLQQKIIFLKSELAKYKQEVSHLKKSDYYSLALSLEQENFQLKKQEKELSMELLKAKRTFQKEVNALQREIQLCEDKRTKLIASIQQLVQEKSSLQADNTRLIGTLKKAQKEHLHLLESHQNPYSQSFEDTFLDVIQKINEQLNTIQEQLKIEASKSDNIKIDIVKKIEHESNQIKMLLHTIKEARELVIPLNQNAMKDSTMFSQLDDHVQTIYSKTLSFEKQLMKKLRMLDKFEQQLIQLASELESK